MSDTPRKLVPVTEEDKKKSYYKYYLEEMAPVSDEQYAAAAAARLTPDQVLPVTEVNRLFDPDHPPYAEMGYCAMPDGSAYMANRLFMPGVTPEMMDWWFAWHVLDPLRYAIWDREDHEYCMTRHPEQIRDPKRSYREKYWGTLCDITESFGPKPAKVVVPFVHPTEMGFDAEKFEKFDGTIIAMSSEGSRTISCHFVRPVEGGVELRTRFWFGWCMRNGKPERFNDEVMPERLPQSLLQHNIKEFTNLARLLPRIFPEERDNF